jgi:hypothetical protein
MLSIVVRASWYSASVRLKRQRPPAMSASENASIAWPSRAAIATFPATSAGYG